MLAYPVKMKKDTNGSLLVTFPDIPEAATSARNQAKALVVAQDALESALGFYFEMRRSVPMPRQPKRGQRLVTLSAIVSCKVLLLNEMVAQQVWSTELARRMGTTPQAVHRMASFKHRCKIDGLVAAFQALGKKLELRVVDTKSQSDNLLTVPDQTSGFSASRRLTRDKAQRHRV